MRWTKASSVQLVEDWSIIISSWLVYQPHVTPLELWCVRLHPRDVHCVGSTDSDAHMNSANLIARVTKCGGCIPMCGLHVLLCSIVAGILHTVVYEYFEPVFVETATSGVGPCLPTYVKQPSMIRTSWNRTKLDERPTIHWALSPPNSPASVRPQTSPAQCSAHAGMCIYIMLPWPDKELKSNIIKLCLPSDNVSYMIVYDPFLHESNPPIL